MDTTLLKNQQKIYKTVKSYHDIQIEELKKQNWIVLKETDTYSLLEKNPVISPQLKAQD